MLKIQGSGALIDSIFGGGGDDNTNLRSRAFLNVLFVLSEGEIAGFPSGDDIRKYIYANDTPIIAPTGFENFRGVRAEWRSGTQFQDIIAGTLQGAGAPVVVGVKVSNANGPIIRTVTSVLATDLRVTLTTPGISRTDSDGNSKFSRVDFKIYLASNGGPFVLKVTDSFEGKTAGGYARDYTFRVDGLIGPWQIKVERTNADVAASNNKEQNDLFFQSYTAILEEKFRYPNSALLFVRLDTAYFKAQPSLTIKLKGVICRILSNYNPTTRVYTGLWDGTFTRAWTNNPAWCLLELLTNKRFGCGNYIELDRVDKWSLYRMSQYCDELVSNGLGGVEPRFVYNEYMREKQDAFGTIQSILAQCRAVAFYAGGQILFSQDRPGTVPSDVFNDSNVVCEYDEDGRLTKPPFVYDYVSLKEKHAKAHVFWYDPNEYGKRKTAYTDLFDIGYGDDYYRYGDEVKEVDLKGCTSGAEAKRHGKWILATERLESQTIAFATGEQGLVRLPGNLVRVADSHNQGRRLGGRIVSASSNSVVLDAAVTLVGASNDLILMVGGVESALTITNPAGTYSTLNLAASFTALPQPGTPFAISGDVQPELYRLVAISDANDGSYALLGVLHNPIKYAVVDSLNGLNLDLRDRSIPKAPTNLIVRPILNGYFLGWQPSESRNVVGYELQYEEEKSNRWTPITLSSGISDVELVLPIGNYRFRAAAVNLQGKFSEWLYSTLQFATVGKIIAWNEDGSIVLDRTVKLQPGVVYYLDTQCKDPAGVRPGDLPNPYPDRRKIITPAGITNIITVSPSYLGNILNLGPGDYDFYAGGNPNNDIFSYLKVVGNNRVTLYDDANFAGNLKEFSAGVFRADYGNFKPIPDKAVSSARVQAGMTCFLAQHEPGNNPVASSNWLLTSDGTDAITDGFLPILIAAGSSEFITI